MVSKKEDAQIYPLEGGSRELAGELRVYLSTRAGGASYAYRMNVAVEAAFFRLPS
jgi:hypothetical protein